MRVCLLVIGRAGALLAEAIAEYERRAARYWNLEVIEVREERARKGATSEQVKETESRRLLERAPRGLELCALTRTGQQWSSDELAQYLSRMALQGSPGATFLIGGALGLSDAALEQADRKLSISSLTLTHELARLVLTEQLYRAGTIVRGEPYHKART